MRTAKAAIENGIRAKFGFHSEVVLRTLAEWKQAIAKNPFPAHAAAEPSRVLVVFLSEDPGQGARKSLIAIDSSPEELRVSGREIYIYYPNGMARPKLPLAQIEKMIRVPGTGRNWNTVLKIRDLAEELESS